MNNGNTAKLEKFIKDNPGKTRGELLAATGYTNRQIDNYLNRLRDNDRAHCKMAGRYSTWFPGTKPQRTRPVNSVWAMGAV